MAKFCRHCGSAVQEGTKFCPECGKSMIEGNATSGANSKSNVVGIVIIVLLIALLGVGIGYYVYSTRQAEIPLSSSTPKETTSTPAPATPDNTAPAATPASDPAPNTAEWNDLVREKNAIDVAIGSMANRANSYLSNHTNFSTAGNLKDEARALVARANQAQQRANALSGVDASKRSALARLFTLEAERAQGIYKGMIDSSNGGDYSLGFKDGTRASYAFDDANSKFNGGFTLQ